MAALYVWAEVDDGPGEVVRDGANTKGLVDSDGGPDLVLLARLRIIYESFELEEEDLRKS
jgi:hypothetical protein